MARTISKGLAPILERLELDRPQVVTLRDVEKICAEKSIATEPRIVAARLKDAGWLLPTGVRGTWEFAPAELAGPYPSYDPLLPVKALTATNQANRPLLRGQTAAWALGLADRVPSTAEIALPPGTRRALPDTVAACTYKTALPPVNAKGALSLAPEAVLVQMADRPSSARSWSSAAEWLPYVMAEMAVDATLEELHDKSASTAQRTGYLLQGARPDIADAIFEARPPRNVAHLGRGVTLRSCAKWMVADTMLPWDPERLFRAS